MKSCVSALGVTLLLAMVPAQAQPGCKKETGKAVWSLIDAPNEPIGRILGPITGTLTGASSAYLASLTPSPTTIKSTSVETWVFGPNDSLVFTGAATFTPQDAAGTVGDELALTVKSGTGIFKGATGSLAVKGIGYNVFGPNYGPGNTYFDVTYDGIICRAIATAAVAGPKAASVVTRETQLDGSKSVSSDGKALTYVWTIPPGSPSAGISQGNTATPVVQFGTTRGLYNFLLTVTDSKGVSATDTVSVNFVGF